MSLSRRELARQRIREATTPKPPQAFAVVANVAPAQLPELPVTPEPERCVRGHIIREGEKFCTQCKAEAERDKAWLFSLMPNWKG